MNPLPDIDFARRWRRIVEERARQTEAAYARLGRSTGDYWERRASRFAAFSREARMQDPFLEKVRAHVDAQSTALDVGAGTGRHAVPLARAVRRVVAVEPSKAMASHLRAWAKEEADARRGLRNIRVVAGTWPDVEVPACDVVLCSHVMYPIADIVPFVRKLDEKAKRYVFLWLHQEQMALEALGLWEVFHGEPRARQPTVFDAIPVLWQMGLRPNVEMSVIPQAWSWETLDEAVENVRETLALPEDPDTDARLRDELSRLLVERDPDGRGGRLWHPQSEYRSAIVWWGK